MMALFPDSVDSTQWNSDTNTWNKESKETSSRYLASGVEAHRCHLHHHQPLSTSLRFQHQHTRCASPPPTASHQITTRRLFIVASADTGNNGLHKTVCQLYYHIPITNATNSDRLHWRTSKYLLLSCLQMPMARMGIETVAAAPSMYLQLADTMRRATCTLMARVASHVTAPNASVAVDQISTHATAIIGNGGSDGRSRFYFHSQLAETWSRYRPASLFTSSRRCMEVRMSARGGALVHCLAVRSSSHGSRISISTADTARSQSTISCKRPHLREPHQLLRGHERRNIQRYITAARLFRNVWSQSGWNSEDSTHQSERNSPKLREAIPLLQISTHPLYS
uniref:Uncharacterized protein n=1 Tax=Echinococcus granulosus TaxID=6210 RepID=A0A068X2T9_ECHGR|nr:hypothetical protein EgrG_002060800 [Echinococcus granulosus]